MDKISHIHRNSVGTNFTTDVPHFATNAPESAQDFNSTKDQINLNIQNR